MAVLRETAAPTEVLLVHAPYPGRLKFQGVPSSLFAAIGPFVAANGDRDVSYLDPRGPSVAFYQRLRTTLASGRVRALCISTSTAAIEETARIAALSAEVSPATLVVVGGPHEDSVDRKSAMSVPGVHLSIAGDAESALQRVLEQFLSAGTSAQEFLAGLTPSLFDHERTSGRFTVACAGWVAPFAFDRGANRHRDPRPLVFPDRYPRFDVFDAEATIPLMVSRGCPYGRCTFCAEANRDGTLIRTESYEWIERLAQRDPGAALYFQDSIFPSGNAARAELLPLLRRLGRPWGCQVYLPMLNERQVAELADHGCRYLYTGVESGAQSVLDGVRKPSVHRDLVLEAMGWAERNRVSVGLSLMFGAMSTTGEILESSATLDATVDLASAVLDTGVRVAGFYPNVLTVLPGTQLARGLATAGHDLDFYAMPRAGIFDALEDGGVGYNFLTLGRESRDALVLAEDIVSAAHDVQELVGRAW